MNRLTTVASTGRSMKMSVNRVWVFSMLLIRRVGSSLIAGLDGVVDDDPVAAFEFELTPGDDRVSRLNSLKDGNLVAA